jgi:glycosyltransferase involved in cell wall biosynthesis
LPPRSCSSISIVIPVYNEENRITGSLNRILDYCTKIKWDFEIIFVEDGSTDRTVDIIRQFALKESRVKLVSVATHLGKGGSIKSAILSCASKEIVAYMDIDLSADPSELSTLISHIDDHDLVIGSRMLRGHLPRVKRPIHRAFLSLAYSLFFRALFRIAIYDPQCGFKIFRREVIFPLFNKIGTNGFAFDSEVIVKASSLKLRIKEVPINWRHGKFSTLNVIRESASMASDILLVWYDYHRSWKIAGMAYPQKRGSIYGRLLFSFLSASPEMKQKYSRYLLNKTSVQTLLTAKSGGPSLAQ